MSTILDTIVAHKREEVEGRKALYPAKLLEQSLFFHTPTVSLRKYLLREDKTGIIAEFKRRSPSQQAINLYAKVEEVSIGYMQAGAAALSILTDERFFGGSAEDLREARRYNFCPILRKDFIIDPYQIIEARSWGADAILLIAACLKKAELQQLADFAHQLGMEVLVEIYEAEEIDRIPPGVDVVGVNNRNLRDFSVSIQHSLDLFDQLPAEAVKISESGIESPEAVMELRERGYRGFLIGTRFMQTAHPGRACREFIHQIERQVAKQIKANANA